MSSKNNEESGHGHNLDLLIILHNLQVLYHVTITRYKVENAPLKPAYPHPASWRI